MNGVPKWFGTRQDVLNWQAECEDEGKPEQFTASLQKLYDGRLIWGNDVALADNTEGITDATHRVLNLVDMETKLPTRTQQELIVDPNAYIFTRLGFTDGECRTMLGL